MAIEKQHLHRIMRSVQHSKIQNARVGGAGSEGKAAHCFMKLRRPSVINGTRNTIVFRTTDITKIPIGVVPGDLFSDGDHVRRASLNCLDLVSSTV